MWNAKEGKRLIDIHLDEANRKIAAGEKTRGEERLTWKKEKDDLTMAKTGAKNAKVDAEAKVLQIQDDLHMVKFKLSTTEAQLKEAKAKASVRKAVVREMSGL